MMPELPEVEIARRNLSRWALGHVVVDAHADDTRVLRGSSPAAFRRLLRGRRLEGLERRGKNLIATFAGGAGLLSHFGMDGRWVRRGPGEEAPRHARARLVLDDDRTLIYVSARLLGRLVVGTEEELRALPEWSKLGLDPLLDSFTPGALAAILAGRRAPVKITLMNQQRIAGLGNIQVAEALWLARIHPATPSKSLSRKEIARLHRGILRTLHDTIAESEGEEIEYLSDGKDTENPFRIYDREGEPCRRCGIEVSRIRMSGRSTFFCPGCQPEAGPA